METVSVGPWGDLAGREYSYKVDGAIVQIVITSGEAVESVTFKHNDDHGLVEFSDKFGDGSGTQIYTMDINYPTEYLTSISGTIGELGGLTLITSLSFDTNKKSYGPYGKESGTYFVLPMEGVAIAGFHGHADNYIRSIGVYVKPLSTRPISVGPWGGSDGQDWSYKVEGAITQIIISSGDVINNIEFKGDNGNGLVKNSNKFGGDDGSKTETIDINNPEEYLMSISGTLGEYGELMLVTSLRFNTNQRTIGPFGKELGTDFSLRMNDNVVVGFHGRASRYILSIGVFVKSISSGN